MPGRGISFEVLMPEPSQGYLLAELVKLDTTIPAKLKNVVAPVVEVCDLVLEKSQKISDSLREKVAKAVPTKVPQTINATNLAQLFLEMLTAVKAFLNATTRPLWQICKSFNNLILQ
jgi:hypothetical protein